MGLASQLTGGDAKVLRLFLKQLPDKRTYVRALTLCLLAEGQPMGAIVQTLEINRREVYRWLHSYLHSRDPEARRDRSRSGRPRVAQELTEKRILAALGKDPRKQGFAQNAWTVATLARYLNRR
jgi:hypothetical protein